MYFVHVADHALDSVALAQFVQPASVILIKVPLQQPAAALLAIRRMPHFEILV